MWSEAPSRALAWLFRPQCAACAAHVADGLPFCDGCAGSLTENLVSCPRCAEALPGPRAVVCRRCRDRPLPMETIVAPWQYGGALADAIRRLKFERRGEVARALAPLIAPVLVATAVSIGATLIVPVPLHWTRRLRRGFDQSALLLARAAALAAPPCAIAPALRRRRATPQQSRRGAPARFENLRGAMEATRRWRGQLDGARVVVFDDVVTTGATMAVAAQALRRAGARVVVGVALARAGTG
ncbi:MAG: phosphoribosyltransferase family protein [Kofleriaceae bacterium]